MGKTQYWMLWEAESGTTDIERIEHTWKGYQGELSNRVVLRVAVYQNCLGLTCEDSDSAVLKYHQQLIRDK